VHSVHHACPSHIGLSRQRLSCRSGLSFCGIGFLASPSVFVNRVVRQNSRLELLKGAVEAAGYLLKNKNLPFQLLNV
jgi:hypothetical protein